MAIRSTSGTVTSKGLDRTLIVYEGREERVGDAGSLDQDLRTSAMTDRRRETPVAGRLLRMGASTGAVNMGIDEALAILCRDGVTLRFYAWESPTLSIGYAQRCDEIDLAACRKSAVHLVRRPTGGRAVLHRHDLTYSLILPLRLPWTKISVAESYRRINICLLRGLKQLGLEVSVGRRPRQAGGSPAPFCFLTVAQDELLVGGKKIVGSAQRRFPAALLQQGSILFTCDRVGILDLLCPDEHAAAVDALRTVSSLREALGWLPNRLEVETAIRDGFAREMGIEFAEGELEPEELTLARGLANARYSLTDWTFRR